MMRIVLFLATNFGVLILVSIVMSLLGVDAYLAEGGINYGGMLLMCALFGFGGSMISLFLSKWMAKRSMRVQLIDQPRTPDERWLYDTTEDLARAAGIKMPEVGIFPSAQPNAFATGWNKNDALVAVSQGLFQRFSREEVRAVMAHEIGHVANGDMVTLTLIQGVVNTFVLFFSRIIGYFVDRVVFKNESGHGIGFFITTMAAQLVLGFLASAVVAWFSRFREFRADEAGATLASKAGMISALERLKSETQQIAAAGVENDVPDNLQAFGISGMKSRMAAIFATHPPLDVRIQHLEQRAG